MATELERRLLEVLRALAEGEVVSYGDVAEVAGFPGRARAVGNLLGATDEELPWWRVVNSVGRLVPGAELEQAALLRAEGVTVRAGHVTSAPSGRFRRRGSRAAREGPGLNRQPTASQHSRFAVTPRRRCP
jgi:methylated-DNA-protein-cysteine methyltransferase-like protein